MHGRPPYKEQQQQQQQRQQNIIWSRWWFDCSIPNTCRMNENSRTKNIQKDSNNNKNIRFFFVRLFGFIWLLNVLRVLQVLNEILILIRRFFSSDCYCNCCCCCHRCYLFVWTKVLKKWPETSMSAFGLFFNRLGSISWNWNEGNGNKVLSRINRKKMQRIKSDIFVFFFLRSEKTPIKWGRMDIWMGRFVHNIA